MKRESPSGAIVTGFGSRTTSPPPCLAGVRYLGFEGVARIRLLNGLADTMVFYRFVHSVGMYNQLCDLQESEDISFPTHAHLDRAHLALQVRIQEAQGSLSTFYYDDAHFAQEDMPQTLRAISDRFRKFLKQFYEKEYGSWPIRMTQPELWLDRSIVNRLQQDFGALYEYCIDRNMTWNERRESSDRKERNLLKSISSKQFGLDAEDYRMLGVFRNLDDRLNTSNIPYPYPLLPITVPAPAIQKKKVFGGKKTDKVRESKVAHAYAEASNAFQISREHANNELAKAFVRFEKLDQLGDVDPREVRQLNTIFSATNFFRHMTHVPRTLNTI